MLGGAAAHLLLMVLGSWVSNSFWSAKNAVLFLAEFVAFAAIQNSDPGYVPIHQSQDGEIDDLTSPPEESEVSHRSNPLVPLRWSRRAWKPGAGIHVRFWVIEITAMDIPTLIPHDRQPSPRETLGLNSSIVCHFFQQQSYP